MASSPYAAPRDRRSTPVETLARFLIYRWWTLFVVLWGLFVGLAWLAPVFMALGWEQPAGAVYFLYSFQCHQLPERSYFLFGPRPMYTLEEIQAAWVNTNDPMILRQFVGDETLGWKVAWSDRMVSMYTSVFAAALLYPRVRRRLPRLPLWSFGLLLIPMAVDGASHLVSDTLAGGVGSGFRDTNAWLAELTGRILPAWFYAGDGLASFNWWMRLLSGVLFGLAVAWLAFPYIDETAREARLELERAQTFASDAPDTPEFNSGVSDNSGASGGPYRIRRTRP